MRILDWIFQPLVGLFVRRLMAEAEVQTAIRCAESLQQAYARADQLEAEGFEHLAKELRAQADGIDISNPGQRAVQYANRILDQPNDLAPGNSRIMEEAAAPLSIEGPEKTTENSPPKKRGRGRPRKNSTK